MDNQHKKIKGYRDLSQQEINLMNRIKQHAEKTALLIQEVSDLRKIAQDHDIYGVPSARTESLTDEQASESMRCLALAKTNLQTGQMWLVRAVALPDSF